MLLDDFNWVDGWVDVEVNGAFMTLLNIPGGGDVLLDDFNWVDGCVNGWVNGWVNAGFTTLLNIPGGGDVLLHDFNRVNGWVNGAFFFTLNVDLRPFRFNDGVDGTLNGGLFVFLCFISFCPPLSSSLLIKSNSNRLRFGFGFDRLGGC